MLLAVCSTAVADTRPNIIYFLSDDHRADFLGCAGHPIVKTPVIDGLAEKGVRFENSFVTTSICAASRASIFTGLVERTHQYTFGMPPIAQKHMDNAYPVLLKKAGYRTGFVGKFGVNVTGGTAHMFDVFTPLNRSPYHKKMPDGTTRHVTEIAGDKAIAFLEGCKKDQPFCLSVSFNAAHAEDGDKKNHFPWPKAEDGLYDDVNIPVPELSDPAIYENHPEFMKRSMNRSRFFWRWDTPEKYQQNVRDYYRMITGLDRVMGRVLDAVKEMGFDENTVVIFSGDNGYYKAARGFAGKWSHYEQSLRVPMVIYDPRAKAARKGNVESRTVLNIDLPATMLRYADVPVPDTYQGKSLVPLVEGQEVDFWRTDFFCEHLMDNASIPKWEGVRDNRYVYARYFEQKPVYEYLHDLKADPDQLKNFVDNPEYAKILEKMRARTDELRDSYGGKYVKKPRPKKR
jgi:arylsulfatase A-like enzyme